MSATAALAYAMFFLVAFDWVIDISLAPGRGVGCFVAFVPRVAFDPRELCFCLTLAQARYRFAQQVSVGGQEVPFILILPQILRYGASTGHVSTASLIATNSPTLLDFPIPAQILAFLLLFCLTNGWARCFRIYGVFVDAPNDSRLRRRSHSMSLRAFKRSVLARASLHGPCLALRARITHPRGEIAEAPGHSRGGRHPHKKGTARRLESSAKATSSASTSPSAPTSAAFTSLTSVRSGSNLSRGVVEYLRAEAYLLAVQLVTAGARSPARASADEMRGAVDRERGIRGMIPRAVAQVFRVAEALKLKGCTYTMERQPLEIPAVQETITNLFAPAPGPTEPPRKHGIHHRSTTRRTIPPSRTHARTRSPALRSLLAQSWTCAGLIAARVRTNERGSGAAGRRARERDGAAAQRINRNPSLRALGDVVAALARMSRCPAGRREQLQLTYTYVPAAKLAEDAHAAEPVPARGAPERVTDVVEVRYQDVNIIRPEQREALILYLAQLVLGNRGTLVLVDLRRRIAMKIKATTR
ncbi:hypothetical protein FB451DRAFT_1418008 [Mycena latifolia]|nr:hypothetical protein FB451DRAFT_1418008 [Mycena latifolia]